MYIIEYRNRTDNVNNFRKFATVKGKSFKDVEKVLTNAVPGLVRRSAKPKPGKRIESVNFSCRDKIYSVRKIG